MSKAILAAPIAAAGFLLLCPPRVTAQAAELRVFASNGVKGAMDELKASCEREIGHSLALTYSSTAGLKKKIEAGEAFDLTIITEEAITDLVRQGKIAGDTRAKLGRSELGIGIRAGAPKPDIRTTDALKAALRKAKSITYPQDGATRGNIERMFERLGIATEVQPRIILAPSSGAATASVADGRAGLVLTLFSEIVPIPGLQAVGPLPGEFESSVKFDVAASSASKNLEGVKAAIGFLVGPRAASTFKAKGIERR